ncbi:MAG: DUF4494 domain-containing protein [Prevotellaceae bacterium]|jgi:hypothetical protein|nr:DUF4494 domain-containing protein [Prevotellaceae bacterium]
MNWFECNVSYETLGGEDGLLKKENKLFLVDALTFSEVENRVIDEVAPFNSGELTIGKIRKVKIAEVIDNEVGDRWYKCKMIFTAVVTDEKTQKEVEKKTSLFYLVKASILQEAIENLLDFMKTSASDFTVASVVETLIEDILNYQPSVKNEEEEDE